MEIIAAISPKSYGIKEAYNRLTVKSNAFSLFVLVLFLFFSLALGVCARKRVRYGFFPTNMII